MKKLILTTLFLLIFSSSAFAYTDVSNSHDNITAINYITDQGIAQGYDNGSFQPGSPINRAEFTKIIVEAVLDRNPTENAANCFIDITSDVWYSSYVCYAKFKGYLSGYSNGSFDPSKAINLVEAAKILTNVFEIETQSSVGSDWFSTYIEAMGRFKYIPESFSHFGQLVNRADMAEMIWRILENKQNQNFIASSSLQVGSCQASGENVQDNIDMDRVRGTWMDWYNGVRGAQGLHAYTYNRQLDRSAIAWSELAEVRGYLDHRRTPGDEYYDYWKITDWFSKLGLTFENVYRVTHTENIGWGVFNCSESETDRTDELINNIRGSFDFYMGEKNQSYRPHYNSIMNAYFNEIGLGIAIDEAANKYYLTVHYGTRIISNPLAVCNG